MSKCVSKSRGKLFSRITVISMISIFGAGCSTDFSRLDDSITTASLPTKNQRAIIKKTARPDQEFPGGVDTMSTASIGPKPTAAARRRVPVSQPYPGAVTRKALTTKTKVATSRSRVDRVSKLAKSARPRPVAALNSAPEGQYETVREMTNKPRKLYDRLPAGRQVKPVSTSSDAKFKAGWTAVGGTRVTLRNGENLYNLSRRYGVPVKQIMRVNDISNAKDVTAGQKILIPTYTYSRKVAVSAPDANRQTRASRSTRGYKGEAISARVAVPTPRAVRTARLRSSQAYPVAKVKNSGRRIKAPAAASLRYTVVSGDTLNGIARRHKVSKSALRKANAMDSNVVRIGQKLTIPKSARVASKRVASLRKSKKSVTVDPVVTGGPATIARKDKRRFAKVVKPVKYTTPSESAAIARRSTEKGPTPDQTGVSKFRWPARGRVVSKFGTKTNGAPNDGIDISVPVGTPVKATENGTVIYAGSDLEEFGKLILVRHSNGWVSAYAYSSKNLVSRGDTVRRGQVIARSGRSGKATIPKIHFELRKNSNPVNPLIHLTRT